MAEYLVSSKKGCVTVDFSQIIGVKKKTGGIWMTTDYLHEDPKFYEGIGWVPGNNSRGWFLPCGIFERKKLIKEINKQLKKTITGDNKEGE